MSLGIHSRPPIGIRLGAAAIAGGWRFLRAHGAAVQRARVLCFAADLLELRRPRGWQPRRARLYRRAAHDLDRVIAAATAHQGTPQSVSDGVSDVVRHAVSDVAGDLANDPATRTRALLRAAEAPYRRARLALAGLGASLLASVALLVLLGCWISPSLRTRLFPPDLAAGAPWVASSAVAPNPISGVGPSAPPRQGLFFHTQPSEHPWIEIDLRARRVIRSIEVANRSDCCEERALPLNFEIFDDAKQTWRFVVQRRAGFGVWSRSFPPVVARRVRLRLAGTGLLHLRRISVYEW